VEAGVILSSDGTRHDIEVPAADAQGRRRVVVDGQVFDVQCEGPGPVFRVRVGDRTETLHCVAEGSTLHLFWQGRAYRLTRESAAIVAAPSAVGSLTAPMPGKIIAVEVAAGQTVTQGQPLVIVEAMKMETVVRAPRDGRVRVMSVSVGDRVTPGTVLVELE
jgi:3-methylcrotonyl-CoA carboxylase alpha subunit